MVMPRFAVAARIFYSFRFAGSYDAPATHFDQFLISATLEAE
jgi:hypothetical protein